MSNTADTDSTNTPPSPSQSHREVFNLSSVKWYYSFALDIPRVSRVLGGYVEGDKEWRRGAMKAIRGAESTEELRRRIKSFHVKMERKTNTQPPFTLHPSRSHVVKSRGLGSVYKVYLTSPSSSGLSRGYAVKGGWSKEENVGNGFVGLCGRLLGEDYLGLGGGEGEFQDGWGKWWEGGKEMGEIRNGEGGGVLSYLQSFNRSPGSPFSLPPTVVQNYRRSLSFYAVTSYVLGLGDRHLWNVLLTPLGWVRNVDFEFLFCSDPKFYEELRVLGIADPGLGDGWERGGEEMYQGLRLEWRSLLCFLAVAGEYLYGEDVGRRRRVLAGVVRRLMLGRGEEEARERWREVVRNAKSRWIGPMAVDVMHGWGT
ncbi:hypothetical protein TrCOL_g8415 [Triparma columacea]|uniref:PI3K/PI4K catalytic domain-containing protein n=1 Tax=Triparma columacea TaxID=722753 RepID=A0A9W7GL58_9STRA|nr:hypothetical protein TrCOL_g8415 [Triparma columacea]